MTVEAFQIQSKRRYILISLFLLFLSGLAFFFNSIEPVIRDTEPGFRPDGWFTVLGITILIQGVVAVLMEKRDIISCDGEVLTHYGSSIKKVIKLSEIAFSEYYKEKLHSPPIALFIYHVSQVPQNSPEEPMKELPFMHIPLERFFCRFDEADLKKLQACEWLKLDIN